MTDRSTVASAIARADSAHQKIEDHERLCAERYGNINSTLGELKAGQRSHQKIAWGIAVALLGWMAVQLWNGQVMHPANPAPGVVGPITAGPLG